MKDDTLKRDDAKYYIQYDMCVCVCVNIFLLFDFRLVSGTINVLTHVTRVPRGTVKYQRDKRQYDIMIIYYMI